MPSGFRSKSLPKCGRPRRSGGTSRLPATDGGFHDGGFWAITKLNDVKEMSRRSDVFSSYENGVIPRFNNDIAREDIEVQRFVMLNMDAPHHTRLRKIISRGFTPRAVGRLRGRTQRARSEDRRDGGGRGFRRLRRAGVLRAAAAGDRRFAGCAAGGPRQALRVVERDDRHRRPGVRPHRPEDVVGGVDRLRDEDGRGARPRIRATTSSLS